MLATEETIRQYEKRLHIYRPRRHLPSQYPRRADHVIAPTIPDSDEIAFSSRLECRSPRRRRCELPTSHFLPATRLTVASACQVQRCEQKTKNKQKKTRLSLTICEHLLEPDSTTTVHTADTVFPRKQPRRKLHCTTASNSHNAKEPTRHSERLHELEQRLAPLQIDAKDHEKGSSTQTFLTRSQNQQYDEQIKIAEQYRQRIRQQMRATQAEESPARRRFPNNGEPDAPLHDVVNTVTINHGASTSKTRSGSSPSYDCKQCERSEMTSPTRGRQHIDMLETSIIGAGDEPISFEPPAVDPAPAVHSMTSRATLKLDKIQYDHVVFQVDSVVDQLQPDVGGSFINFSVRADTPMIPISTSGIGDGDHDGLQEAVTIHRPFVLPVARRPYKEHGARHDLGRMNAACEYCAALHWIDERVLRSSLMSPKFGTCCNHGQVRLPQLENLPPDLQNLFTCDNAQAREFRDNIRQYNAALAFTSLGVNIDHTVTGTQSGPYVFRIHGQMYHEVGSLLPTNGKHQYAELYILDPHDALKHRMNCNTNLHRDTMQLLQDVIIHNHPYAIVYKRADEILKQHLDISDGSLRITAARPLDRLYCLPTVDEVAVLLPGDGSEPRNKRDIILRKHAGPFQRISDLHPAYQCLHYVLFFPYGTDGWHQDLHLYQPNHVHPCKLSQTRFYAYYLYPRKNEFSLILRGGHLFQQWLVDMWASAEQSWLFYLCTHQAKLRASQYRGFQDMYELEGEDLSLDRLGERYVLPSSFQGSPRQMYELFQDAMAIARYYKKIDLFMTVTANPKWTEITRELLAGQTAADRPDLVTRVFQLKKQAILHDIFMNGVLGRTAGKIHTIEFQKRGLPHMHLLIIFQHPYKILTPQDVDSIISATWPDPEKEPHLFETVKSCMVHGPCGVLNLNSPCMKNSQCSKGYPKAFQPYTVIGQDGYPLYYRPDDSRKYDIRGLQIDNRYVVSYCPFFSFKYDCHINVECCVTFSSLKYLNKYVHKGFDHATIEIYHGDEVRQFLDGRYVATHESFFRISHWDLHEHQPNVVQLDVHLPGQHFVTFDPNEDPQVVQQRAAEEHTKLTAFFAANTDDSRSVTARQYTYQEFPQHFIWKKEDFSWQKRQEGFALGRMYYVPPSCNELFYLRTLLTVAKGPKSYEDLRTVKGVLHSTFREACIERGLLQDDGEWRLCLQEAAIMQTGTQLHHLFVTLLLHCHPTYPDRLWNDFRHHICDDLQHHLTTLGLTRAAEVDVYDYGLSLVEESLAEAGHSLREFTSMPFPQRDWSARVTNPYIAEQLNYNSETEAKSANDCLKNLNPKQRDSYDHIIDSVDKDRGKLFFLSGPGGTGKTYVYKTVESLHAVMLREVKLIVWDEAVMQHKHAFEAVDRTLRDIRDDDRPFGGITVVFGGDFQQILPVIRNSSREQSVEASLQRSYLWRDITILWLQQNMRLDADSHEFADWLLDIGHGRNMVDDHIVTIPESLTVSSIENLIESTYPNIKQNAPHAPSYFLNRIILAARNEDVDNINSIVLKSFPGEDRVYPSADTVALEPGTDEDAENSHSAYPIELLRSLSATGLPSGELHLKEGCLIILLRNLAPQHGLCNGSQFIVQQMSERVLEVRLLGGEHHGEVHFIPRITLSPSNHEFPFMLRRRQFPVRLAFTITINKAQGQSLEHVGIDLRVPVFEHGQLYVALSRAMSAQRIKVLLPESAINTTVNIVYPEVLLDRDKVLENIRQPDPINKPRTYLFDACFFLAPNKPHLIAMLRYYDSEGMLLDTLNGPGDSEQDMLNLDLDTKSAVSDDREGEVLADKGADVDSNVNVTENDVVSFFIRATVAKMETTVDISLPDGSVKEYDLVGDVIQLNLSGTGVDILQVPHLTVCGIVSHVHTTNSTFEMLMHPSTSALGKKSSLPLHVIVDRQKAKWKNLDNVPFPQLHSMILLESQLLKVEKNSSGLLALVHVDAEQFTFFGHDSLVQTSSLTANGTSAFGSLRKRFTFPGSDTKNGQLSK
ncbi:hypothetical protein EW146_g4843 [Bondarzewia mesenterica]|uniref:ATP-dependent DNA helicase n=1 Tax=Bondarzewia mesenterica TaxID=1095465 RepID=A0A4S4LTB6_9AGAM|nr:hypothetical protein EW146_g4843 [Bondarzewia mesenterica]